MYKLLSVVALLLAVASATHYRYGTMTYVPTGTRTIRLQVDQAWRRSFFGNINVGNTITPGTLEWGDGNVINLVITATSVNLVDDIVAGTFTSTKSYSGNGPYTIQSSVCCRLSTLKNNADGNMRSFTNVNFGTNPNNRSPVSNVLPIVIVGRGTPATFQVTAVDPDGDQLTYRLATTNDFAASGHPSGTSVNGNTGLYSWNNVGLVDGLYNTAVVISDGKCDIMVDFLMQLTNVVVANDPPVWIAPTPADGAAFSAMINNPISFSLNCNDPNAGNTVTIQAGSLPQGSIFGTQSGTNPGSRSFTYTSSLPTTAVACFQCNDNSNAVAGQRCFSLEFIGTCCDLHSASPVLNGVPSDLSLECGATVQPAPTVTASAVCPDNFTPVVVSPSESQTGGVCNRVITRTWTFTDTCQRTTTRTQTVTIRDTTAPTIDTSAALSQTVNCGSATSPAATGSVTASDVCDASVTIASNDVTTPSSCLAVASIARRWTATDDCNNVASYTQTINVVDSTLPSLSVPADITRQCAIDNYTPAATGSATASDTCDSSVVPTYSDSPSAGGCLALASIARTWTAQDDCGNSVSGVQTISFQDTIAPATSVDPVCVFPPTGQYYCFDVTNVDFLHYSDACSTVSHQYNGDCQNADGTSDGCVRQGNQLCVRASTNHVTDNAYTFSFTVSDVCGNSVVQGASITVPNHASSANCRTPTVCINDCPESQCEGSSFDLITEAGDNIGSVYISNKLNTELDIEVKTNEGSIPDRGWWMLGLNIQVGSRRVVKDWNRATAQSRWFATIDLQAATSGAAECDADVSVIVAVLATNDKRNNNGATIKAYPSQSAPSKKSFTLPPNIQDFAITYDLCCECTIRTQTQNDFGNLCYAQQTPSRTSDSPRIREIACYTNDFWTWSAAWCFPNGLTVGCNSGFTVTYTNPTAVATSWADETTARVLTQSLVNPGKGQVGLLGAEAAALSLNLKFDECDAEWSTSCTNLADYHVCQHPSSVHNDCQPWWGQTVSAILAEANSVLGGCSSGNANALATCVRYINRAFVDGKRLWEAPDFQLAGCPAK